MGHERGFCLGLGFRRSFLQLRQHLKPGSGVQFHSQHQGLCLKGSVIGSRAMNRTLDCTTSFLNTHSSGHASPYPLLCALPSIFRQHFQMRPSVLGAQVPLDYKNDREVIWLNQAFGVGGKAKVCGEQRKTRGRKPCSCCSMDSRERLRGVQGLLRRKRQVLRREGLGWTWTHLCSLWT